MLEVFPVIEESVEPIEGIGAIRILVNETGHGVNAVCQPGRSRKPECGIIGQVESANPDAVCVVEKVCPGTDQREDIDVIADIEITSDHFILPIFKLLVPVQAC